MDLCVLVVDVGNLLGVGDLLLVGDLLDVGDFSPTFFRVVRWKLC